MADTTNVSSGGLKLSTILFLIFLVLKLTGYIDWSWWWVTCPLWFGVAAVLVFTFGLAALCGLFVAAVAVGAALLEKFRKK